MITRRPFQNNISLITGWRAVERNILISHDLETTPLQIKTDSTAGSWKLVQVFFYTARGYDAGYVNLYFILSPQYRIGNCMSDTDIPSTLTSEVSRICTITKLPGPRITLQCNGVIVLDITLSDDTCSDSDWSKYWSRQIE